jgi:hypothetical protein
MSIRSTLGLAFLLSACGGNALPPQNTGPTTSASVANAKPPASGDVEGDALVFDQYDGPKGTLRTFGDYAWTIAPMPSSDHTEACSYKQMALLREKVIGKKNGMVVFKHHGDDKCRFAVPPALVVDDDASPLAKGDVVLVTGDIDSDVARVEATEGDDVTVLVSRGTYEDMKFDAKSYDRRKVKRPTLRVVRDGLTFGGRVAIPNGEQLSVETVFAATDDAVFVVKPFGTKFPRNKAKVAAFTKPLEVGAKVGAKNSFGTLANATIKRGMANMIYEIETPSKKTWVVGFADAVRLTD